MSDSTIIEFEFEGETLAIDRLDFEDPTEAMTRLLDEVNSGDRASAMFDALRLLGISPAGWRISKALACLEAIQEAVEMSVPESSGSEVSSEPTAKKSSTRSSSKG